MPSEAAKKIADAHDVWGGDPRRPEWRDDLAAAIDAAIADAVQREREEILIVIDRTTNISLCGAHRVIYESACKSIASFIRNRKEQPDEQA